MFKNTAYLKKQNETPPSYFMPTYAKKSDLFYYRLFTEEG